MLPGNTLHGPSDGWSGVLRYNVDWGMLLRSTTVDGKGRERGRIGQRETLGYNEALMKASANLTESSGERNSMLKLE